MHEWTWRARAHTHTHTHTHTYTHGARARTHTHTLIHMARAHTHTHTNTLIHMARTRARTHTHTHIYTQKITRFTGKMKIKNENRCTNVCCMHWNNVINVLQEIFNLCILFFLVDRYFYFAELHVQDNKIKQHSVLLDSNMQFVLRNQTCQWWCV